MLSSELIMFYKRGELKVSITKLKEILIFNGAIANKHLGDDKKQRGFCGVLLIEDDPAFKCVDQIN